MKREKILKLLQRAAEERLICNVYHKTEVYYTNCWPLMVSEELLVCAHDSDFQINGCGAYAIDSLDRVVVKEDKCQEISRAEGIPEQIIVPEVSCDSWQAFFASLPKDELIGVDRVHAPEEEAEFVVGRIVKAGKKRVQIRYLDADGEWQEEPWRIRYEDITGVTFGDRYLTTFAKYAGQETVQPEEEVVEPAELWETVEGV